MGLFDGEHLTVIDHKLEAQRQKTFPGMAHLGGSGPARETCRNCTFWSIIQGEDRFAANGRHHGALKPRSCRKYQTLMRGEVGPVIPHNASACKYFEKNATPPPLKQRR